MQLIHLNRAFAVCKIADASAVDLSQPYVFLSKTPDELSLVCEQAHLPSGVLSAELGWDALRVAGALDFSLVGVIARISGALAEAGISLFAVSTFDTDYVLIKAERMRDALQVLRVAGFEVI